MADFADLRLWAPGGLEAISSLLADHVTTLRGLSDELEATAQPAEWVGAAADAAYTRRGEFSEGLRRLTAQVQAVSTATDEAGGALRAVQESLRETDELAGRYWFQVADDGSIRDVAPDDLTLSEHDAGDRERMARELVDRVAEVRRSAQALDAELTSVLDAAAADTIDDGAGTTLLGAAFAGLAFGQDTTTLPPPEDGSPASNNAYWDALSEDERQDVLRDHPEWVGNLDGIPAEVRDEANRAQLPDALEQARADLAAAEASGSDDVEAARARVASLEAITRTVDDGTGRQLLVLDTSGEMVKAAVAVGDVDTADHVSVHVPGMTTTVDGSLEGKDTDAAQLRQQTEDQLRLQGRGDETVASVTWIGYEAPQWSEFNDDFDLTDTVATDDTARDTAPTLASFLNGIDASRTSDPNLTTLAHSYGTTTTGYALQEGTGVDNAVFYGSPGLGTSDVSDLGVQEGHVFVQEANRDPVADFATFGADPNQLGGVTGLSTDGGTTPDGVERGGSSGHSEYNLNNSMAQYNQAVVVAGMPELAVQDDGFGLGDVWNWWPGDAR